MTQATPKRRELNPFAPPSDQRTFCAFHGPQAAGHCVACDDEAGIDRVALAHEQERNALLDRLRELGFSPEVTPVERDAEPGEAVPKQTVADQRAALLAQLESLPED